MVGSRRRVAGLSLLLLVFGVGVLVVSEASGQGRQAMPTAAEGYQPGPIASRAESRGANLPDGFRDSFGLGVLVALLFGFRASGLAKSSAARTPVSRPD